MLGNLIDKIRESERLISSEILSLPFINMSHFTENNISVVRIPITVYHKTNGQPFKFDNINSSKLIRIFKSFEEDRFEYNLHFSYSVLFKDLSDIEVKVDTIKDIISKHLKLVKKENITYHEVNNKGLGYFFITSIGSDREVNKTKMTKKVNESIIKKFKDFI